WGKVSHTTPTQDLADHTSQMMLFPGDPEIVERSTEQFIPKVATDMYLRPQLRCKRPLLAVQRSEYQSRTTRKSHPRSRIESTIEGKMLMKRSGVDPCHWVL